MNASIKSTARNVFIFAILGVVLFSSCSSKSERVKTRPWQSPIKVEDDKKDDDADDVPVIEKQTAETKQSGETGDAQWVPPDEKVFQTGVASWYGPDFNGKRTANGEIYDMEKLTAAHQKLPFHTLVEVENIDNHEKVVVRINDRGPFIDGRIIDLSRKAARRIGMLDSGTAPVHLRIIKTSTMAKNNRNGTTTRVNTQPKPRNDTAAVPPIERETITSTPAPPPPQLQKDTTATGTVSQQELKEPPVNKKAVETVQLEPEPPVTPVPGPGGQFYVQVGAFSSTKNANRQLKNIRKGIPNIRFTVIEEGGLFKVVSPGFRDRAAAMELKNRLLDYGFKSLIKKKPGNSR